MEQFLNAIKEEANKEVYGSLFEKFEKIEKIDEEYDKATEQKLHYKQLLENEIDKESEKAKLYKEKIVEFEKECHQLFCVVPHELKDKIEEIFIKEINGIKEMYNKSQCSLNEKVEKMESFMLNCQFGEQTILALSLQGILKEKTDEELASIVKGIYKHDSEGSANRIFSDDDEIYSRVMEYQYKINELPERLKKYVENTI